MISKTDFIEIVQLSQSVVQLLKLDGIWRWISALGISSIATIGMVINSIFIYYVKYEAPQGRLIKSLMFFDKVRLFQNRKI